VPLELDPPPSQAANAKMKNSANIKAQNFSDFMSFTPFWGSDFNGYLLIEAKISRDIQILANT
jgi:hypothetical protein